MLMALGNLIKAVASLGIVLMLGLAGFVGYREYENYLHSGKKIAELTQKNEQLSLENQKLALANRLLKVDYQLAYLKMKTSYTSKEGERVSVVDFWEVDDEGNAISEPQEFHIHGGEDNIIHIDGLAAKFDDELVEQADPLRGTAMFAFRRIYGQKTSPDKGHILNSKRTQPSAYKTRGGRPTPFEKEMWEKVWDIAHDPGRMKDLKLRALHGQGGFMQLREGNTYVVRLRSTGDVTITLLQDRRKVQTSTFD